MIPVILQVHVDRGQWVDVPVLPDTSCRDIIECCREPSNQPCRLIQNMGFSEEAIPLDSCMLKVLSKYGDAWPTVNFHLQYSDTLPDSAPRPFSPTEFTHKKNRYRKLPEGSGELSLVELRQMAARQQHQIEAHQQLLVAKEQRLKFLKQQEVRHQQHHQQQGLSVDADTLRHLREKVQLQELKVRRLRALRGQVEQHRSNNTNLSAELDSIRALFNEKEKELSLAVAKVEELTRQLEDVRRGGGDVNNSRQGTTPSPAALEFQKLRRELLYRSKLNEQQNARIAQQRETLARRQSEISQMDQRIAELQQRLQRKRQLNTQLSSQLHATSRANPRATIVAVEPLKRAAQEAEIVQDDLKISSDPICDFTLNKKDPKYQTLPYNTKFAGLQKNENNNRSTPTVNGDVEKHVLQNGGPPPYPEPPNRFQYPHKPSPPHGIGNLSPRPFGSTYSTSLLTNDCSNRILQELSTKSPVSSSSIPSTIIANNVTISHTKMPIPTSSNGIHHSKPLLSYSSHQSVLPPTVMTSQSGISRTVPQTPARQHIVPNLGSLHVRSIIDTTKPMVPPKPGTPSKPIPPPRQIHGLGMIPKNLQKPDTVDQALSVLKGNTRLLDTNKLSSKLSTSGHHTRIPPSLNQHSPLKPELHLNSSKDSNSESDSSSSHTQLESKKNGDSVHTLESSAINISLNRRIGMPPAFFFPENQIPPSDLNVSDAQEHSTSMKRRPIIQNELQLFGKTSDSPSSSCGGSPASVSPNSVPKEPSSPVEKHSSSPEYSPNGSLLKNSSSVDTTDRVASDQDIPDRSAVIAALRRAKKGNLKTKGAVKNSRRVSFDPLALLLDAALEGELELVKKTAKEVTNPSAANDEGITALHNAICAGHFEIVKFLVEFGCDVNAQDSDGWTPLHCAASCNNLAMVKYLVERGACIFATTLIDQETAAEKCEEKDEGFDGCSEYLYSMQEKLGILNCGAVYALYAYEGQNSDELSFKDGDQLVVLRKGDDLEREWWWSQHNDREGYVPRNLLGLYPRVTQKTECQ